jgi:hypothetical protein
MELRMKIISLIDKYQIEDLDEVKKIEKENDLPILQYLFNSITRTPISLSAPSLTEKLIHKNTFFYYSHTQDNVDELIEKSFERYNIFILEKLQQNISNLFSKAGYKVEKKSPTKLDVKKGENEVEIMLYSNASEFYEDLKSEEFLDNIIIIPQGATPGPYINIYKEFSNELLIEENVVLLVNVEKNYIAPFIGYPKDELILNQLTPDENINLIKKRLQSSISDDF